MQDILIVVDMQNDFIDGALGTPEAVAIVPKVVEKIRGFNGKVFLPVIRILKTILKLRRGVFCPFPTVSRTLLAG